MQSIYSSVIYNRSVADITSMLKLFTMRPVFILTTVLLCLAGLNVSAQADYHLIYDHSQSMIFGAENEIFVHRAVYSFQDQYIPDTLRNERGVRKAAGFGYRMGKLLLLDLQEDYLFFITQHEVFGHGARFREFGSEHNKFEITLAFPFGTGSGSALWGTGYKTTPHRSISVNMGGVEGEDVMANTLTENILLSGRLHYRQALLFLLARNGELAYVLKDRFFSNKTGGGDMAGYIKNFNTIYGTPGRSYSIEKMSVQNMVTFINPLQLYSAFTLLYTYGIKGRKYLPVIPMLRIGNVKYLPYLNYELTPFGNEFVLSNNVLYKNSLITADLGISEGTLTSHQRLRVHMINAFSRKTFKANVHFTLWNEPELELESYSTRHDNNVQGGLVKADVIIKPSKQNDVFGFFLQAGYKTKGFETGEQLDKGLILRYGLNFTLK
jgi:hypothetical protein